MSPETLDWKKTFTDDMEEDDGSYVSPSTKKNRYYKRYYYTTANYRGREELVKRNLMKLEHRAKNFYKENNKEEELNNLKCRNCYVPLFYGDLIDHALECMGVDRLIQYKKRVYHCPLCVYATYARLYMIEHLVIQHCNNTDQTLYQCKPCKQGFPRKALFEHHKFIRHKHKFEYYCFICNKSYYHGIRFKDHMLLHLGHRYQCPLCGKNTTSVQNLQFHLMALHWGDRKNFTCRTCGKKFALKKQLREHDRVHSGYAPAKCKICNQSFALFSNLNAHYNKHLKVRRFSCTNCSLNFTYLSNLIRHRRIKHSQHEGKYVCNYCGKSYIDKRDYTNHVSVHMERKSGYTQRCHKCNATFRIKKFLTRHMKTHLIQYRCTRCNKTFKQNTSFIRHSLKHFNSSNSDNIT
ncbi:hypothetical protein M8J75_008596 [Diaphorina citri]|nr:hypothetical protein M8J75_008596 [Diaphorina citri]